jgi:hypothetical protein
MAHITQVLVGDRRLQLGKEQFIRTLAIGDAWQKLRIGALFAFNALDSVQKTGFYLAACRGPAGYEDAAVDMVGGHYGPTIMESDWVVSGASIGFLAGNSSLAFSKVGAALSTSGTTGQSLHSANLRVRNVWMVDITRGSPSYTVKIWRGGTGDFTNDRTFSVFLGWLEDETNAGSVLGSATLSVPYSGSGLLDSVAVRWGHSCPICEISALAVVRYA